MKQIRLFFILALAILVHTTSFAQEYVNDDAGKKVLITTSNKKTYVGVIVEDLGEKIRLETDKYGVIVISKSNIVSQEAFDEESYEESMEQKMSTKEYTLVPSAFNLAQGEGSAQTHYFGYWNFEKGLSDNFSIDLGITYPLFMPLRIGFKTSAKVVDGLRVGLKVNAFSFIDLYGIGPSNNNTSSVRLALPIFMLLQANPMITIGNAKSNLTLGGSISYLTKVGELGYSGFFGGQFGLSEKWSLYTEFISAFGADQNFFNQIYSASLGGKYYRSERKTWTFALTSAVFPTSQSVYNSQTGTYNTQEIYYVLPLPYIGYRIIF